MNENYRRLFHSINDAIKRDQKSRQAMAVECLTVLNEIIRPAIVDVRNIVQAGAVEGQPEHREPSIRVRNNELRFVCIGDSVDIIATGAYPANDTVKIADVSEELVLQTIARFLRQSFGLSSLPEDQ